MSTYLSLTSAEILELLGGSVPETVRSRLDGSKAIDGIFSDERNKSPMNQKFFEVCQQVHDGKAFIISCNVNLEDLNIVTFDFTIIAPYKTPII